MSAFFTDTDCELWYTEVDKLGIKNIFEMPYTLDDEEIFYDYGRKCDVKHIFKRMKEGATPITSSLNPEMYQEKIEPIFARGEDIVYVHFSDKMSGTFKYLQLALDELKEKYPERKCTLIDTKSISIGGGAIVRIAKQLHDKGLSDDDLEKELQPLIEKNRMLFIVDNMVYLKRGGRISGTAAAVGTMLNLKPILNMSPDGTLGKFGVVMGKKKGIKELAKSVIDNANVEYTIDITQAVVEDEAKELIALIKEGLPGAKINLTPVGPVIGAHCGPGTIGVSYISK